MTLPDAMMLDATAMPSRDIDTARVIIGGHKLQMRQREPWQSILWRLRPFNARLDELNAEQDWRQRNRIRE